MQDGSCEVTASAGETHLEAFVVEGPVRGVVCAVQADIQVQDFFFWPSVSVGDSA